MNSTAVNHLCMGCMTLKNSTTKCTFCGFDEAVYEPVSHHLPLRSILAGKYLVGKVLGEGGFGITYLGWDLYQSQKIAVKEYYPTGFVSRENTARANTVTPYVGDKGEFFIKGRDRFIDEAKSLAIFHSLPGIVSVKDFFSENGTAYIVMEFLEGKTLKQLLAESSGRLPAYRVLEMMKPLMSALFQIHQAGIIHRDISPDNIMVTNNGAVKLLDFGAARHFADSGNKSMSVLLKPGFAPPEQYFSRGIQGPWTDVYAVGATMYRMLTGQTPPEAMERMMGDTLPSIQGLIPDISSTAAGAIMRALSVKTEDRYKSIGELYNALWTDGRLQESRVRVEMQPMDTNENKRRGEAIATAVLPTDIPEVRKQSASMFDERAAFGPWIYEVGEFHKLPDAFAAYHHMLQNAELVIKIPIKLDHRDIVNHVHLYKEVVAVFNDHVLVLRRNDSTIEKVDIGLDSIQKICVYQCMLYGKVTMVSDKTKVEFDYNAVSQNLVVRLLRLLIPKNGRRELVLPFLPKEKYKDSLSTVVLRELIEDDPQAAVVAYQPKTSAAEFSLIAVNNGGLMVASEMSADEDKALQSLHKYAAQVAYIPFDKIKEVCNQPSNGAQKLVIKTMNESIDVLFGSSSLGFEELYKSFGASFR